jgi:hypothetical protein
MKKLLTLIGLFALGFSVKAQSEAGIVETIKGKVVNQLTNEAVAFTNISIEDTFHGTASNEDGEFELKIPEEMENDQIQFSAVGYQIKKFSVNELFNKEYSIIKLKPKSYDIQDVDIAARSKVLIRILRMASENIHYNYIGGPFNLICTYENKKIVNDTTEVTQAADVLIYDKTGYTKPSRLDAYRMRNYEINKNQPVYRFSSGILHFDELLEMDWVRSASSVLNPSLLERFNLEMEDEPVVDGHPAWVLSFKEPTPSLAGSVDFYATSFEGKITIIKEDYSVKKIEGTVKSTKHNRQGKSLAVGVSNAHHYEDVSYDFLVTYSQLKPDLILLNKKYRNNGEQVEERSQLKVEQVQMTDIKKLTARDYFSGE